jgi:hypothetical protein
MRGATAVNCSHVRGSWRGSIFVRLGVGYEILRPIQAPIRTVNNLVWQSYRSKYLFSVLLLESARTCGVLVDREQTRPGEMSICRPTYGER